MVRSIKWKLFELLAHIYFSFMNLKTVIRTAVFSEDGKYRYWLYRSWPDYQNSPPTECMVWLMLNPSKANAHRDDNTIVKCMKFSEKWGYNQIVILNLFAFVSTDSKLLHSTPEIIGPENDNYISKSCYGKKVVCAWGAHPKVRDRALDVLKLINKDNVYCLGITKDGWPKHPLYIPYTANLMKYEIT